MKKTILINFLILIAVSLQAQEEDFSFPVKFKGKSPSISDFVTAIMSQEGLGEWMGHICDEWGKFRKGKPHKGHFKIDSRHGYIRFEEYIDDDHCVTDFCFWNCSDGRHKVVTTASSFYRGTEVLDGQYSGLYLYLYDGKTRRMEWVPDTKLGIEHPDINGMLTYTLPVDGKDIIATGSDPKKGFCRFVYEWNGNGFNLLNKVTQER